MALLGQQVARAAENAFGDLQYHRVTGPARVILFAGTILNETVFNGARILTLAQLSEDTIVHKVCCTKSRGSASSL